MDVTHNYPLFVAIVDEYGPDALLKLLQKLYPQLHLYSISKDWHGSARFILKARGRDGDLVVNWA